MKSLLLLLPVCVFAFFSSGGEEEGHKHPRRFGLSRKRWNRMANEFGGDPEKIRRRLEEFGRRKHHRMSKEERNQCNRRREKIRNVKFDKMPDENVPINLFEVNDQEGISEYLFQGDINLTEEQLAQLKHLTDQEEDPTTRNKRQASNWATKWENNTVYYYLDESLDDRKRASVSGAVDYLQKHTCLNFVQNSTAPNRINVHYGVGCWSNIGMGGLTNLSLGYRCDGVATAAHEFTHALGIYHTQMRSDRDNYVTIDLSVVNETKHRNFEKLSPRESLHYTPYEYGSFMHYEANAFVNDTQRISIIPKDARYAYTMGHRQITFYDIEMINKFYGCDAKCTAANSAKCKNGGTPNPKNCAICNCPVGYGGDLCDKRPSDCGEELTATGNWQKKVLRAGNASDWVTTYDDFRICNYWITAPVGQKIETRITEMFNSQCHYGCTINGIEIKTDNDTRITNPNYCCEEFTNDILVSALNPTPIIVYNRYYYSTFTVEYRYIPQPTPSTSAPLPTTTPSTRSTTTTSAIPTTTTATTTAKPTTTTTTSFVTTKTGAPSTRSTSTTSKPTSTTTNVITTTPTTTTSESTCTCTCPASTSAETTTQTTTTRKSTTPSTITKTTTISPPPRKCEQLFPPDRCISENRCNKIEKDGFKVVKFLCAQTCGLCGKTVDTCENRISTEECLQKANYQPFVKEYDCAKMYGYCEYPN